MPTSLATLNRPLGLRTRPDLVVAPVAMSGTLTWIVKDPATLEHFQFSAEEHALLEWLRESVSINEIRRRFADRFAPQTISPQAVWEFLSRLHDSGLLLGDGPGQGRELLARMRRERTRRWATSWMGLLAIRFRGVDPDPILTAAHQQLRWLFSPAAGFMLLAIVMYAASLVVGHFEEFRDRLPQLSALFDGRNLLWLLLSVGAVKMLHELGHALACKHFGGEVRELGLMLLVFAPCLYCDVSDAWRLPSKWQRIFVSAAGMLVELVLAAMAMIIWWHAQPGPLQLAAMNVMIVCTVGTVLVNGNPLLRYDGYYILSDLVETPNLWQRSRAVLHQVASRWLLSESSLDDPLVPSHHRAWLAAYAVASKTYMAIVCVAIVWGLIQLLYPLHLQNLAYAIGLTALGSAVAGPATGVLRLVRNPMRRSELRTGRLALVATIGLAAAAAVLAMPVTYYVRAPLVVLPTDAARVYATIDGTLAEVLPAGAKVKRGELIGRLENVEAQRELTRVEGEYELRKLRVEHLERLRGLDPKANDELPTARAALTDSERRVADRRQEVARLTLQAPADGCVLPVPRKNPSGVGGLASSAQSASSGAQMRLATWSGSLLETANRGASLEPGTLVCLVGDPARLSAMLLVDDVDAKRLRPGQEVRLRIDQLPAQVIKGEVVDISRHEVGDDSVAASQADLASLYSGLIPPSGRHSAYYQVRVQFESLQPTLVIGGRGNAKVAAERITLARCIARYLGQAFRLPI